MLHKTISRTTSVHWNLQVCLSVKFFVSLFFEFKNKSKVFMVRQILLDTLCQLLKIQILPSVGSNVPADLNCPVSKL